MAGQLVGRKVAFLATDGVEEVELTAPWNALKQAGADLQLVSDKTGEIQAVNHDEKGNTFPVDVEVSTVTARDFDALVLPGGVKNPDKLRTNCKAEAWISSSVAGGSKLNSVLMLRHMQGPLPDVSLKTIGGAEILHPSAHFC